MASRHGFMSQLLFDLTPKQVPGELIAMIAEFASRGMSRLNDILIGVPISLT